MIVDVTGVAVAVEVLSGEMLLFRVADEIVAPRSDRAFSFERG